MAQEQGAAENFVVMRFARIKSWTLGYHVRRHNNREMACPHVDAAAPPPKFLMGTDADVNGAIKRLLAKHGVVARPGDVLALEFVVSASRGWFEGISAKERHDRAHQLAAFTIVALVHRFPVEQIVSAALHMDETTPHVHVVVVPLVTAVDHRRTDPTPVTRLSAKTVVGGRGDMSREQTRFASHFAHLGLKRGKEGSLARHVPNKVHEQRLEDARQAAVRTERALASERADLAHTAVLLGEENEKATSRGRELDQRETAILAEDARLKREREALAGEKAKVAAEAAAAAALAAQTERDRQQSARDREAMRQERQDMMARVKARVAKLDGLSAQAGRIVAQAASVPAPQRTPAVRKVVLEGELLRRAREQAVADDQWLAQQMAARAKAARVGR